MKYILTPSEMRRADALASEQYSVPSIVLMENAARSSAEYIFEFLLDIYIPKPDICIFCGSGNNGGDGFAIARHLFLTNRYKIKVLWIGSKEKMSPETETNYQSAKALGILLKHVKDIDDIRPEDINVNCIIDAILGVGGSENVRGLAANILQIVNDIDVMKIAIDSPTGLNTDTGKAHPDCFQAKHTITMFAHKTGLLINDGPDFCGEIHTAYLGVPHYIVKDFAKRAYIEDLDVQDIIPKRKKISSKFDYGRVLVVAGSNQYPGAAALCSNSAITAGAGLVQLYTTMLHHYVLPEIIPNIVPATSKGTISKDALNIILQDSEKATAVVIGPGLDENEETISMVKELISKLDKKIPILIDGDGLKAIDSNSKLRKNIVLTPHTGEFSRITGISRQEIEKNTEALAKEWANKLNCTILLKYVPSVITDGDFSFWNINGNPGMATAGSGDVLAGIISAFLGREIEPLKATALGAFLHADAGDEYRMNCSEETLTASGLLDSFKERMRFFMNFQFEDDITNPDVNFNSVNS